MKFPPEHIDKTGSAAGLTNVIVGRKKFSFQKCHIRRWEYERSDRRGSDVEENLRMFHLTIKYIRVI